MFVPRPDIRLIAADMDGTLLDDAKELHDHFWPLIDALFGQGILFCPASGRQYHTLYRDFGDVADELLYLAENGAYVVRGREEISSDTLDDDLADKLVRHLRAVAGTDLDLGVVVCGKKSAYIERTAPAFTAEVEKYYASLAVVGDLLDRPADQVAALKPRVLKAIF